MLTRVISDKFSTDFPNMRSVCTWDD